MSKIIKLTEAQLRDVVTRAINEQKSSPNASPAAKQVWAKLSQAQAGAGGLGGTNEVALISAISMITSVQLFVEVDNMMRGASSIGNYKSIVKLLNGELENDNLKEFQQIQAALKKAGVTLTAQTEKNPRTNTMVLKSGTIRIVAGKTPTPTPPGKTGPNKPTYRVCTGFPIKYGCKQTEVGRIQQCLGLKVDYSFGPSTLVKLVDYSTQRNTQASIALQKQYTEIGVSKGAYDLIMGKCKKVVKPKPKSGEKPVVDTRDKTTPTTLASRQIQQLPVNINVAKRLQNLPAPGVDNTRKLAILGQIKDRGFDQVYKGQKLTDAEQQWLSSYMGGEASKEKQKAGGNEKLVFPNR
jgi:hypothetical protein